MEMPEKIAVIGEVEASDLVLFPVDDAGNTKAAVPVGRLLKVLDKCRTCAHASSRLCARKRAVEDAVTDAYVPGGAIVWRCAGYSVRESRAGGDKSGD